MSVKSRCYFSLKRLKELIFGTEQLSAYNRPRLHRVINRPKRMRLSLKIRVAYFCRSIWNFVPNSELSRFLSLSDRHSSIRRHKTLVCDDDLMNFAGRASTLHTSRLTRARVWQYDTMTTTTCIARLPVRPSVSHFSRSVGRSSCAKRLNQRESMTPEGDLRRCSLLHGRRSLCRIRLPPPQPCPWSSCARSNGPLVIGYDHCMY